MRMVLPSRPLVPFAGVGRPFLDASKPRAAPREVLDAVSGAAIFALPPLDDDDNDDDDEVPSWFSGASLLGKNDEARGLPLGHVVYTSAEGADRQLQIVATEDDSCDGCTRCGGGGYQHFQLRFTDGHRRLWGEARVVRTGGDLLHLAPRDAQGATFEAETIFADERAEALLKHFFPALYARAHTGDGALDGLVVNAGTLYIKQLILHDQADWPSSS